MMLYLGQENLQLLQTNEMLKAAPGAAAAGASSATGGDFRARGFGV